MAKYYVSSDQLTQIKNAEIAISKIIADNRELGLRVNNVQWQGDAAVEFKIAFDNYIKKANYQNQKILNTLKIFNDFILKMLSQSSSSNSRGHYTGYSYSNRSGYQNTGYQNTGYQSGSVSSTRPEIKYGNLAGRGLHIPENDQMTSDLNELLSFKEKARKNPDLQPKYLEIQDQFLMKYKKDMKENSRFYWRGSEYYFVAKDRNGNTVKVKMTYNNSVTRKDWFYTGNSWGKVIKDSLKGPGVPATISHSRPTFHLEIES